eukprot:COSAG04_NODE_897_length_9581_cov_96.260599_11_plen_120_part_00
MAAVADGSSTADVRRWTLGGATWLVLDNSSEENVLLSAEFLRQQLPGNYSVAGGQRRRLGGGVATVVVAHLPLFTQHCGGQDDEAACTHDHSPNLCRTGLLSGAVKSRKASRMVQRCWL